MEAFRRIMRKPKGKNQLAMNFPSPSRAPYSNRPQVPILDVNDTNGFQMLMAKLDDLLSSLNGQPGRLHKGGKDIIRDILAVVNRAQTLSGDVVHHAERLQEALHSQDLSQAQKVAEDIHCCARDCWSLLADVTEGEDEVPQISDSPRDNLMTINTLPDEEVADGEVGLISDAELIRGFNLAAMSSKRHKDRFLRRIECKILNTQMPEIAALGGAADPPKERLFRESDSGQLFRLVRTTAGWRLIPGFEIRSDKLKFLRLAFRSPKWPQRNGAKLYEVAKLVHPATMEPKGNGFWRLAVNGSGVIEFSGCDPEPHTDSPRNQTEEAGTDSLFEDI